MKKIAFYFGVLLALVSLVRIIYVAIDINLFLSLEKLEKIQAIYLPLATFVIAILILTGSLIYRYFSLKKITGCISFVGDIQPESNVKKHLDAVKTSFKFMGFGFSKYTDFNEASNGELESAINRCFDSGGNSSSKKVKILIMNPFSSNISKFNAQDDPRRLLNKRKEILDTIHTIYKLQQKGLNIVVKFYPLEASATFRLFIANNDTIYTSYYRASYKDDEDKAGFPELTIRKGANSINFFQPLCALFEYLWKSGQECKWQSLYVEINTANLNDRIQLEEIQQLLKYYHAKNFEGTVVPKVKAAVAAVAGKDSMATIVRAVTKENFNLIIPIIVVTPTEEKQWEKRIKTLTHVRQYLGKELKDQLSFAIVLRDGEGIWEKVNEGFAEYIEGIIPSPCVGCHFYIHNIRSLVASRLGYTTVISGDREIHRDKEGAKVKLNQTAEVLDCFQAFSKEKFKVNLEFPLRSVESDNAVWGILKEINISDSEIQDTLCFFRGKGTKHIDSFNEEHMKGVSRYLKEVVEINFIDATSIESES